MPLALWLHDLPDGREGAMAARRGGLVFGAVYFGLVFYWLLVALIWFTKLAILAFLAALGIITAMTTVFTWLLYRALRRGVPLWVALPVTWTGLEWARAHLPSTLAFPWLGLGSSLTGFPELVGIAEIIGARGVGFWIALVNGLIATTVLAARDGRRWHAPAAVTALLVALPMGWGVWRARSLEMVPIATVAVVQPNIAEHLKLDTRTGRDSTFAALDRLIPQLVPTVRGSRAAGPSATSGGSVGAGTSGGGADAGRSASAVGLVVLPEMTLPMAPQLPEFGGELARLQRYSREAGAPVLFGAYGVDGAGTDAFVPYNSAFLMRPQGLTDFRYDKRFLVPVVERFPFVPTSSFPGAQFFGIYGVGEGWPLAPIGEGSFGVLICYEATYPEASRAYRRAGADILVNITNDAWYGREPIYTRTTALWQHPAHLVMRAIENRVGVARAANTGISLFVDPVGRIYAPTRLFTETVAVDEVFTTAIDTFYTRYGDVVGTGAALACLLLLLEALAERMRARRLDPESRHV